MGKTCVCVGSAFWMHTNPHTRTHRNCNPIDCPPLRWSAVQSNRNTRTPAVLQYCVLYTPTHNSVHVLHKFHFCSRSVKRVPLLSLRLRQSCWRTPPNNESPNNNGKRTNERLDTRRLLSVWFLAEKAQFIRITIFDWRARARESCRVQQAARDWCATRLTDNWRWVPGRLIDLIFFWRSILYMLYCVSSFFLCRHHPAVIGSGCANARATCFCAKCAMWMI